MKSPTKRSKSWLRGFQAAKVASAHSNADKISKKIGAAILCKGNLVAIGYNTYLKTHPQAAFGDFNKNIHAEHKATLKRRYAGSYGMIMYTYREISNGSPACSRPCANCMGIIAESGIRTVRFIDENSEMAEITL